MGSRPFFSELLRKMSAISVLITARKPQSSSAQGACSREEPQPKLRPATSTWQPAACGWLSTKSGFGAAVGAIAPVGEQLLAEAHLAWSS